MLGLVPHQAAQQARSSLARPRRLRRWFLAILSLSLMAFLVSPAPASARSKRQARADGDHWEFTFGFVGGQRDYSSTNFAYARGDGSQGLAEPFEKAPFDALSVVGLRWEMRAVLNHVRMTMGYDLLFSNFSANAAKGTYSVNSESMEVIPQSVNPHELRFGLGGEYPLGLVTPYADLIGAMSWSDAELSTSGKSVVYTGRSFSFAVRAGLRFSVREFFFLTTSAEYGRFGNLRWNTALSAGFHLD